MDGAGVFFLFVLFFLLIWIFTMKGCVKERRGYIIEQNMQYNYPTQGNGMQMM